MSVMLANVYIAMLRIYRKMLVSCFLPVQSFRVFSCQEKGNKMKCHVWIWLKNRSANKCEKYVNFWVTLIPCLSKEISYEFSRLCKAARLDNIVRTVINWSQQQVPAHKPNKQTGKIVLPRIEIVCLLCKLVMWRCG